VEIPKLTDEDKQRFRELVPVDPRVEIRPMFANLGAYVNGNMFAGTFGPMVGVKLAESDKAALVASGGGPFGPAERPMGGYVSIPDTVTDEVAAEWLERALDHVGALPPKAPKKAKPRATKPSS
jgi:TfoX/Sxy family transcriptional regulator of competence genes